jgi:putative ABC transport system ATP-binding protein
MTPIFEMKDLSLHFSDINTPILSNVNYTVNQGDYIIILGSNGSGKSSLLKLLDKRCTPSSGSLLLDGKNNSNYPANQFSKKIKTLTQNCHESLFISLTVFENYLLIKHSFGSQLTPYQLKAEREFLVDYLLKFNPNLSKKLDDIVEKLSGGEKQAFALALIILYPPTVLLLDEHTSALDPKSAEKMMMLTDQMVQEYKITCLLTTHDLSIAEKYGNRILALKNGKVSRLIESFEKEKLNRDLLLTQCY